ncbi:MAG: hypothetical protein JNL70_27770 [Saprospiraceae bacterium]|nr:hypothetical protein [Saprospiraceae bacterium]
MDIIDTTKSSGQEMLGILKRYGHLRLSGYLQPQYQVIQTEGAKSFNGGDFPVGVDSRFMLRRARIKIDYATFSQHKTPQMQFVFQYDGTERGVVARDFWGRFFENKYDCFSLVTGLFARPFGFEINYSSSDREAPERGRMSQILMKTERDLGAMLVFAPQKKEHPLHRLEVSLGAFNGQGLIATTDYDNYKDIIGRIQLKNYPLSKNISLNLGASVLYGGIRQNNKTMYTMKGGSDFTATTDSTHIGSKAPRQYFGADAQLKIKSGIGTTELRAEYIVGTQSATATTSETPATLPTDPLYVRPFDGAYFCALQSFAKKHQIGIKYDWYDANKALTGSAIKSGTKLSAADMRYRTLGFGYICYVTENLRAVLWYDVVKNEATQLSGLTGDLKDNIFTFRLHYRF